MPAFNAAWAIGGPEAHIRFMEAFRAVYRNRVVEVSLLLCAASQVATASEIRANLASWRHQVHPLRAVLPHADMVRGAGWLHESDIDVDDIGLSRPSLDDVFLSLTGHRTEEQVEA